MELASAVAMTNGVVTLGRSLGALVQRVRRFSAQEPAWLSATETKDVTGAELTEVNEFLSSDTVAPLIQLAWVGSYLGEADQLRTTFVQSMQLQAETWCIDRGSKWYRHFESAWHALFEALRGYVPQTSREAIAQSLDAHSFLWGALDQDNSKSAFIRKLLELARSLDDLKESSEISRHLKEVTGASQQLSLAHLDSDTAVADRDELYVDRWLEVSGEVVTTKALTEAEQLLRLVILGNPGAGKSTFVRHLARQAATLPDAAPVVILQCRDYSTRYWEQSLDSALWEVTKAHGVHGSERAFASALLLGRMTVVFDGLDEVTNPQRREEASGRIAQFARNYPLTSIIVTSRLVGYDRTPLPRSVYERAVLNEYSVDQTDEYARTWFGAIGHDELLAPFMVELRTLRDIAKNPLLLSLLCSLYRARGHLPSNRYSVYRQCAELLYVRWDAQRQISSSEDVPDYGMRIMESIAGFFWASPESAGSAEEGQLRKVIAVQLETLGSPTGTADVRAGEFLEFCRDRLWLLVRTGTNKRGAPTYGFTHRTFLEFFAAEYLARKAANADEVAKHILDAHKDDDTSVIPELLIQSYDEKRSPGAVLVYKAVVQRGSPDLTLRLMNSRLPASVRRPGFESVVTMVETGHKTSVQFFEALIGLHSDPREQFVEDYLHSADHVVLERQLSRDWCGYVLSGRMNDRDNPWVAIFEESLEKDSVRSFDHQRLALDDYALPGYLALRGQLPASELSLQQLLFFTRFGEKNWGPGLLFLNSSRDAFFSGEELGCIVDRLNTVFVDGTVDFDVGRRFVRLEAPVQIGGHELTTKEQNAAIGIGLVLSDLGLPTAWMAHVLSPWVDFESMVAVRLHKQGRNPNVPDEVGKAASRSANGRPPWVADWILGSRSFVVRRQSKGEQRAAR